MRRPRPHASPRTLLASALVGLAVTGACAQTETIPASIVQSTSIAGADEQRIQAFVGAHEPGLFDADYERQRRSRDALLEPLDAPGISVAFREAYGRSLWPLIERLMALDDATAHLTGMRLAGALATEPAASLLLGLMDSSDAGMRVFAAGRLARVLDASGSTAPAVSSEMIARIVERLGRAVESDDEPRAADAAVRALGDGARARRGAVGELRDRSISALGRAAGARVRALAGDAPDAEQEMRIALRACGILRTSAADAGNPPSPGASVEVIGCGADALAYSLRRMQRGAMPPADARLIEVQMVRAAETAVYFGRQRAAGTGVAPPQTGFAAALESGEDRRFQNDLVQFLGPDSDLVRAHGFDRSRFVTAP